MKKRLAVIWLPFAVLSLAMVLTGDIAPIHPSYGVRGVAVFLPGCTGPAALAAYRDPFDGSWNLQVSPPGFDKMRIYYWK